MRFYTSNIYILILYTCMYILHILRKLNKIILYIYMCVYTNPKTCRSETAAEREFHRNWYWSDLSVPSLRRCANIVAEPARTSPPPPQPSADVGFSVLHYYPTRSYRSYRTSFILYCTLEDKPVIRSRVSDRIICESPPSGLRGTGIIFRIFRNYS